MRISDLAREAGVAVSAVKYYQREGLLPPGRRTAPNQAAYDDRHVQRVRLVRALLETGGLSIAATKRVVTALDTADAPLAETFEVAQHALGAVRPPEAEHRESRDRVIAFARSKGWRVSDRNPGIDLTARALDALQAIGFDATGGYLDAYADAAARAAAADVQALTSRSGRDATTELMIVGTVMGDPLFAGLRRLAQQDATQDIFPIPERSEQCDD